MVEDRITDGKRIAELLASEFTGLQRGPLDRVSVTDADRDAEPSPEGTLAYRVAVDDDPVARVSLYESAAELVIGRGTGAVDTDVSGASTAAQRDDLTVTAADEALRIRIESGAAVKRAVDLFADGIAE